MATIAPRSQYNRNLTFRVVGGGTLISYTFPIKPQEFQTDTPARVTTTQTLGGIYQDFGGLGVQTLRYQGHTGWRARSDKYPSDGFAAFKSLYEKIYKEYHRRKSASANPDAVYALVIDDLYDTVYRVSLDDFQANKSKANPLLYYYTMQMTVIATSKDTRVPVDYTQTLSSYKNPTKIPAKTATAKQIVAKHATAANPTKKRTYKVVSGDTLIAIAQKYYKKGSLYTKIASANGIKPPYTIYIGQILTIPY